MEMQQLDNILIHKKTAVDDIQKLMEIIKKDWVKDKTEVQPLLGGQSCIMYTCKNELKPDEPVIVRLQHILEKAELCNYDLERKVLQKAQGISAKIIATFQNGYAYEFVKGRSVYMFIPNELIKISDLQLRLIASKMADIHSIKIEGENYTQCMFFEKLHKNLDDKYPRNTDGKIPCYFELKRELSFLQNKAKKFSLEVVQCHGDSHPGNIIWDKDTETITFIDWELTHVGFQAFEIAYFLFILDYEDNIFAFPRELPKNHTRNFLVYYLEKYLKNTGQSLTIMNETYIRTLLDQVNLFKLVVAVYVPILLGIMSATGLEVENDFYLGIDPSSLMCSIFQKYKDNKKALLQELVMK